jgi:hypothetical protein
MLCEKHPGIVTVLMNMLVRITYIQLCYILDTATTFIQDAIVL